MLFIGPSSNVER